MKDKRLGRGMDALFTDGGEEQHLRTIPVDQIRPASSQPRKAFDQEKLQGLAASIREQGIIQPLIAEEELDGGLRLVAGERRLRAARMAGLEEIPVIVREYSEQKKKEAALIENIQREDLNPIEEAEAIQEVLSSAHETQESLAKHLGLSRTALANALRLLRLPPEIKDALVEREISAGHARALLSIPSDADRLNMLAFILSQQLSVRETEHAAAALRGGISFEKLRGGIVGSSRNAEVKKKSSGKKKKKTSLQLLQIEDRLIDVFGTRVRVKGAEEKGSIEIPYYSRDDFQRILDLMEKISPGEELSS